MYARRQGGFVRAAVPTPNTGRGWRQAALDLLAGRPTGARQPDVDVIEQFVEGEVAGLFHFPKFDPAAVNALGVHGVVLFGPQIAKLPKMAN
jgi:hypothetical protein